MSPRLVASRSVAWLKDPSPSSLAGLYLGVFVLWYATTIFFFAPPFYTYDSYHYLSLSLKPEAFTSHSIGFGLLLRGLTLIADVFGKSSYLYLYLGFQAAVYTLVHLTFILLTLRLLVDNPSNGRRALAAASAITFYFVCLGNAFLMNSVWPEMTTFFQLALVAGLITALNRKWNLGFEFLVVLTVVWAYHTRYLMVTIPICFWIFGAVAAYRARKFGGTLALKWLRLGALSFGGVALSLFISGKVFPSSSVKQGVTKLVVTASVQCTHRCGVKMYEVDCSTPEGKELIENSRCTEFIFRLKPFGKFAIPDEAPVSEIFRTIGAWKTFTWVLKAPLVYLRDIHSLEMGYFEFGRDLPPMKAYPEVEFYRPYLTSQLGGEPTQAFLSVVRLVDRFFIRFLVYHILTALLVAAGIYVGFRSKIPAASMLCLFGVSQYFLFSYLNPHVPFRYLMMIITPALAGVLISLAGGTKKKPAI